MRYFFVCFVVGGVFDGLRAQVSDYETTLGPLPPSSFSCRGLPPGYYADLVTGCRTYHVCDGHSHFTYVCPPRTLFRQQTRICDHAYLVPCNDDGLEDLYAGEGGSVKEGSGDLFLHPEEIRLEASDFPEDYDDFPSTTDNSTAGELLEPSTNDPPTTQLPPPTQSQQSEKYLKFSLKDFRSLFYIPDVDHNSIIGATVREFLLPLNRDNIKFTSRRGARDSKVSSCPGHCEPRFLIPGTCRPCVMIK